MRYPGRKAALSLSEPSGNPCMTGQARWPSPVAARGRHRRLDRVRPQMSPTGAARGRRRLLDLHGAGAGRTANSRWAAATPGSVHGAPAAGCRWRYWRGGRRRGRASDRSGRASRLRCCLTLPGDDEPRDSLDQGVRQVEFGRTGNQRAPPLTVETSDTALNGEGSLSVAHPERHQRRHPIIGHTERLTHMATTATWRQRRSCRRRPRSRLPGGRWPAAKPGTG